MRESTRINDRYGLPISTGSPLAAQRYVEGVDLLLSQNFGPEEKFREAVEADEGFALAHAALAAMLMLRVMVPEAKESVERAARLTGGITPREQRHVEAIRLYVNGEGPKSLAVIREQLAEYPRDSVMMTLCNRLLILGCSGAGVANYPQELFAIMKSVESDYGDDWAFLGRYSFAHHETGQLEEARRFAERSLELRSDNAVASHSEAHVFFETGDHPGGADFLDKWIVGYDSRASFYVHLSWHLALFELALGHYERALSLYESCIRPSVIEKSPISLADSASLMWRLQMYGGSPPPVPWHEVGAQAAPAAEQPGPAFRDAHAALAFAASGDEESLGRMIDGLRDLADKGNMVAGEVTLPLTMGIMAFAEGNYGETVRLIEPIFPQFTRLGGSHAQREVFEDTLLEAYLKSEQFDKAEDLLRARLKRRTSVRDTFWLGRAHAGNGQMDAAGENLRGAAQGWSDADSGSPEISNLNHLAQSVN